MTLTADHRDNNPLSRDDCVMLRDSVTATPIQASAGCWCADIAVIMLTEALLITATVNTGAGTGDLVPYLRHTRNKNRSKMLDSFNVLLNSNFRRLQIKVEIPYLQSLPRGWMTRWAGSSTATSRAPPTSAARPRPSPRPPSAG